MFSRRPIRVLAVDDSALFLELLVRGLSAYPDIQVVGAARDSVEAMHKAKQLQPDVMTCDVVMPGMTGPEFLRRLLPRFPLPVIVISSAGEAVFDAMHAGAVDFMVKPHLVKLEHIEGFMEELAQRIREASLARIRPEGMPAANTPLQGAERQPEPKSTWRRGKPEQRVIAIGASIGGTEAVSAVLRSLSPSLPGIVIVQHIPPLFSKLFADRLHTSTPFRVKEAEDGDRVEPGRVLIAPGDRHMRLVLKDGGYGVECLRGKKISGHCPSVDVLFESVALAAGPHAIGMILTGMGYDGAKGLLAIRRRGGRTLGQDRATSVV